MNTTLFKALALLTCLALTAGVAQAADAGPIHGAITGYSDANEEPLASVHIEIRPIKAYKGKSRSPATDLVGVAISGADGSFSITELASPSRRKAYPLMAKWTYRVKVVAPGHYVFDGLVDWDGKDEPWDFMLEAKVTDVIDASGVVVPEDRELQSGALRRGE